MSVTTIPSPRIRLSRIVPASLVALGLAVGATAAVGAMGGNGTLNRSPAAVSVPHVQQSLSALAAEYQVRSAASAVGHAAISSANAVEHRAIAQSHHGAGWTASSGLPTSPAISELSDTTQSNTDTMVRFGPR